MTVDNIFRWVVVAMLAAGLTGAVGAQTGSCKYDVAGDWQWDQGLGRWVFFGEGVITSDSTRNWYADDAHACYIAHIRPAFYVYFSHCDFDSSGAVDLDEVQAVSRRVWPGDQPNLIAAEACIEANESDSFVFCSPEDYNRAASDMQAIRLTYPVTQAILDPNTVHSAGHASATAYTHDTILCAFVATDVPIDAFADLDACYGATPRCLFRDPVTGLCGQVWPEFAMPVDVVDLLPEYQAAADAYGGICELNMIIGGGGGIPFGFHYTDFGGGLWEWTVRPTAQCSLTGCECDRTITVRSNANQPWQLFEVSVVDNTTGACVDPRF